MRSFFSKYVVWKPAFFFRDMKIMKHFHYYEKSQYEDLEETKNNHFNKFKKIFIYSYNTIEFYKKKYQLANIHPDDITCFDDIKKIPILTKQELMKFSGKNFNSNFSGKKFKRSTSGSTGQPFVFFKDAESLAIMDAIQYRNYAWMGIDIGFKQARFWGHPVNKRKLYLQRVQDLILNRIRLSPFSLEESSYKSYLKRIESFKAQYIYGYAQSIFYFSQFFYNNGIDLSYLNLKAVILTGEMIFPYQIEIIKKVFGCNITEEYGCTEVGIIGFRCEKGNMHLMDNLLIEEVNDLQTDNSGLIIVSELYGAYFPFIRYQTGDKGKIGTKICNCGRKLGILTHLSGRKDDFIKCPDGKLVDPYLFEYIFDVLPEKYGKVFQFRIVQKTLNKIEIFIVAEGNKNRIDEYLKKEFYKTVSSEMRIDICFVLSLKKDASGKLRCFTTELLND